MSKRLTDTEVWKKDWFYDLDDKTKLFWFYILSDCDAAGVWTANFKIAEAYIGHLNPATLILSLKDQIVVLNGDKYWLIRDFIRFQYGYPVNPKHTMFKTLNSLLENRGLTLDTVYDTVCDTVYNTVKVKEKEIVKEIQGGVGGKYPTDYSQQVGEIISYLNSKSGKQFRSSASNIKPMIARLNEGYIVEDFKMVIDNKLDWMNTDMQKFIRPLTLFGNKFESYLNEKPIKREQPSTPNPLIPERIIPGNYGKSYFTP